MGNLFKGYTPVDLKKLTNRIICLCLAVVMLLDVVGPFSVAYAQEIDLADDSDVIEIISNSEDEILELEGNEEIETEVEEKVTPKIEVSIEMVPEEKPEPVVIYPVAAKKYYTEKDVMLMAITLAGEAGGTDSETELSAVAWTILNRVDSKVYPNTIAGVVTMKSQFSGYRAGGSYTAKSYAIARDVLDRWSREKAGDTRVGRTLPKEYLYFKGDGVHNYFTKTNDDKNYFVFGETPYKS